MSARDLRTSRRIVFQGLGALGVAAALAGCGGGDSGSGGGGAASESGAVLASTSEVPVGGGLVVDNVVITQPTEGEFTAFSAACTHQGTTVEASADGIVCPNHGSTFSVEDGSATQGPATAALAAFEIEVRDGQVRVA
ncbi:Rieske (2Fe-2S) protein [Nocardioides litoris]|uniref:Rieske (2Fe-2S) protein n=1 Tax=Nocardioides litoris TaxID=1926648 RepID=UPI0011238A55|nr:Rieske (2Fe-2S) protein [Nocardioides litoris]